MLLGGKFESQKYVCVCVCTKRDTYHIYIIKMCLGKYYICDTLSIYLSVYLGMYRRMSEKTYCKLLFTCGGWAWGKNRFYCI